MTLSARLLRALSLLFVGLLVSAGCHRAPSAPAQTKSFPVRGVIVSTDASRGEVTLSHEAIPGFMEAMTMPYKLKDRGVIGELHAGDHISAALLVDQDSDGYHNARLDQIVVTAQARPDYKPAVQYHVPEAGDTVPDFALDSQTGKSLHLAQFKGKVVLLTFIYTRCPLEDFCPRMNKNFSKIDQALAGDAALYGKTHLLSISFDTAYDTPATLRAFAKSTLERQNVGHWEFAVPSAAELPKMEQFFDLGVTPGDDSTFNHSLSTLLIDKSGKVAAFYHTNDWDPQEVLARIRQIASA